jgi:hypothetical protein
MQDVLERESPTIAYGTPELMDDLSELHLDARTRLLELLYECRQRERHLEDEVRRLRDLIDGGAR